VAVAGYFFLGESMTGLKALSLAMIVVGVIGLNAAGV
jgi:small multidrug resistance pump